MEAFKSALKDYFVYEGKDVMYLKNEKQRVRAACASENCPWLILTSWNSAHGYFQVKTLFNEHNCGWNFSSNLADRQWITSKLVKRLLIHPDMKPKQAMEYMIEDYNIQLSGKMISMALKAAKEEVISDEGAQYGKIRDYLMKLHRTNPGSTARLDVIPQPESLPLFDRLYISLNACKNDFIEGCRPLIGLDSYFLKGYYGGQLLSAVGQDGNNHFFVIAYAVVPNECMPCRHAVAAMSKMGLRPENFVHKWLTIEAVQQIGQNNSIANAEKTTLDAAAKAKKNKKKFPKTSATGQSMNHSQEEEINVSQSAPQADEVKNDPKLNW
ncbi:uncharacterized protein LOC107477949 [Arachis duranensis]|uniref:Uncharacterized protein LOC107477949 n=1 Tax=Arachis duranensis TaxID=130453 RepID=A0A6P4CLE5_ARADU|nr:uncharacterized protein LOC107477949 [Arachis duranensis]